MRGLHQADILRDDDADQMTLNRREGLRRIGIVVAVLWFVYWGLRAAYWASEWFRMESEYAQHSQFEFLRATDEFWKSIIAAFLWPALAYGALRIGRWVYRGFVVAPIKQSEAPSDEQ